MIGLTAVDRTSRSIAVRVLLAAIGVLICYQLEWRWLTWLTSELNLRCDWLAGIPLRRFSYNTVIWNGVVYRYEIACIFADVWCGSIPLLWRWRRSVSQNLAMLAVFSACLLVFNVFRLSLSDVLFSTGVPWWLAHSALGGAAWFVVWIWIWQQLSDEYASTRMNSLGTAGSV